jgi:hypothetical protein
MYFRPFPCDAVAFAAQGPQKKASNAIETPVAQGRVIRSGSVDSGSLGDGTDTLMR